MNTETQRYEDRNDIIDRNDIYQKYQKYQKYQHINEYKEFILQLSIPEKLAYCYIDYGPLTDEEASLKVFNNKEEKEKITSIGRPRLEGVYKASDSRPSKFYLAEQYHKQYLDKFKVYLNELEAKQQAIIEQQKEIELPDAMRSFLKDYIDDSMLRRKTTGSKIFIICWPELIRYNTDLAEAVENDPQNYIRMAKSMLQDETGEKWSISISGFDDRQKIAKIKSSQYGKLINLHGEMIVRGTIKDRLSSMKFECPSCGQVIPITYSLEEKGFPQPTKCGCGRKGNFRKLSSEVIQVQPITIQEIAELLNPGEQPVQMPCLLTDATSEEATDKYPNGSKVTLTGCYIRHQIGRSVEYDRVFLVFGLSSVSDEILNAPVTEEVHDDVKRIFESENPLQTISDLAYTGIVGHELKKEFHVLQAVANFHILNLGEPGLGKTEILKSHEKAWPRTDFIQSSQSTKAGITAAASKDEHTGRFYAESNALTRLHPHGIACIDELDKASEDVKFSLLGVMQDKKLKVRKTNIQADLDCNIGIVASANPKLDLLDSYSSWAEQVNLPRPLSDRFHIWFLYSEDVSKRKSWIPFFEIREAKKEGLSLHNRLVLREVWRKAWSVEPDLSDKQTLEWFDKLMKEVIVPNSHIYGSSNRLTETLPLLLEGLCRITLKEKPTKWHFVKAEELLRKLKAHHDEINVYLRGRANE